MGDAAAERRTFTEQDELRWHQLDLLRRIQPPQGGPPRRQAGASIVVPTRVLLDQWYGELTGKLSLPTAWVGRRSGDYKDRFGDERRVMIYVVNSARAALGRPLSREQLGANNLLVVDECHRAGSVENQRIFERPRAACLGLSATPERDVEAVADGLSDHVPDTVFRELGPIIHELNFREALKQEIVPPFELIHVAVRLTETER